MLQLNKISKNCKISEKAALIFGSMINMFIFLISMSSSRKKMFDLLLEPCTKCYENKN